MRFIGSAVLCSLALATTAVGCSPSGDSTETGDDDFTSGCTTTSGLNFRDAPSTSGAILRTFAECTDIGSAIATGGADGKWRQFDVDGTVGWVHGGYIQCGSKPASCGGGGDSPPPPSGSSKGFKGYHFLQSAADALKSAPPASDFGSNGGWGLVDGYGGVEGCYIQSLRGKGYRVIARLDAAGEQGVPLASDGGQLGHYIAAARNAWSSGASHIVLGNELNIDGYYNDSGRVHTECRSSTYPLNESQKEGVDRIARYQHHMAATSTCSPSNYGKVYKAVKDAVPGAKLVVAGVSPTQSPTSDDNSPSAATQTAFAVRWTKGDHWLYKAITEIRSETGSCPDAIAMHGYGDVPGDLKNDIESQRNAISRAGCGGTPTFVTEFNFYGRVRDMSPDDARAYVHRIYGYFSSIGVVGSTWFTWGSWGGGKQDASHPDSRKLVEAINGYQD